MSSNVRSFDRVEVADSILDRFRVLPTATTWAAVANVAGVTLPFMEGVRNFTPGKRLAARARTLRFLPRVLILMRRQRWARIRQSIERWRVAVLVMFL